MGALCCLCSALGWAVALASVGIAALLLFLRLRRRPSTIGFFHPNAAQRGGGEAVLWRAVAALNQKWPGQKVIVYAAYSGTAEGLRTIGLDQTGGVDLPEIELCTLHSATLLQAKWYPVFTMLGQSLGSVVVCLEGLLKATPTVFLDTVGCSFTYPLASLVGCRVGCYTHYPTISTDMLDVVQSRQAGVNNNTRIAKSAGLSKVKVYYYGGFASVYGVWGRMVEVAMVNSSWTGNHIKALWKRDIRLVFPPTNVGAFTPPPGVGEARKRMVLSIAQFRPEKNHELQLQVLRDLRERKGCEDVTLVMAGRAHDPATVDRLKSLISEWGLGDAVTMCENPSNEELCNLTHEATVGIHTMRDEHFGISVGELMAGGAIPVAHDSAGPKMDIITRPLGKFSPKEANGGLADKKEEYVDLLERILSLDQGELSTMRRNARQHSDRFGDDKFGATFCEALEPLLSKKR